MRTKEPIEAVFLVTDLSFDVRIGRYVAHLRRILPQPTVMVEPAPLSDFEDIPPSDRRYGRDALTHLVAGALYGSLESEGALFTARTSFKEYQFRPLIKYLHSPDRRILIADEAGLGKTIEAGYILIEELARSKLGRIVVLCPASLRTKWRDELWRRFGLHFDIATGGALMRCLNSDEPFHVIASFDSLWAKSNLSDSLSQVNPIDLLVIDEVHHLIGRGGETIRRTLGLALSKRSHRVVALSATPIQLEFDDLRRVLEVVLGRSMDYAGFRRDIDTRLTDSVIDTIPSKACLAQANPQPHLESGITPTIGNHHSMGGFSACRGWRFQLPGWHSS